jgi:hypothetical protein
LSVIQSSIAEKRDEALENLRRAVAYGYDDTDHMSKDEDLKLLRGDPRLKEILASTKKVW